jgi:hypothetical protein
VALKQARKITARPTPYMYTLRRDGSTRVRFLCQCGAGTGVPGGKNDPMPVAFQWVLDDDVARAQGKAHVATHKST